MSLSDRFALKPKGGTSNQGLHCSVAVLLATMPDDDAAELRAGLDTPWRILPHTKIERDLGLEGYYVGTGQIGKHRRGDCRCTK